MPRILPCWCLILLLFSHTQACLAGENLTGFNTFATQAACSTDQWSCSVDSRGAILLQVGPESYRIESSFTFPGENIGVHRLYAAREESDTDKQPTDWQPTVDQLTEGCIRIVAQGKYYQLTRLLSVVDGRLSVEDKFTSHADEPVGVIIRNRVRSLAEPVQVLLGGELRQQANQLFTNPTVFIALPQAALGLVAEDSISRVQMEAGVEETGVTISLQHLALQPSELCSLRWACYPFLAGKDYWSFINRVRRDWNVNRTLEGPFAFGVPGVIDMDNARLRDYLERKNLKLVAIGPWLDYDCFDTKRNRLINRQEARQMLRETRDKLKSVDPEIQVLGCMEGPFVSVPVEDSRALYDVLPEDQRGATYPKSMTDDQIGLLSQMTVGRLLDSVVRGEDGKPCYELYYRGSQRTPLIALLVYPSSTNTHREIWLDQARFLMEDVGLDGIYLDGGGPVSGGRYTFETWDGLTVDIDSKTGRILRKYTDHQLQIVEGPCRDLFEYVLSKNGQVVANGYNATQAVQQLPIVRFMETGSSYNPLEYLDEKPPRVSGMSGGHLGPPVALANPPYSHDAKVDAEVKDNYAQFVMKSVVTNLRHGLLYYYYGVEVPSSGTGSGDYGPMNFMYPITPVELHEGWVLGRERIVSARSLDIVWRKQGKPQLMVFNLHGRPISPEKRCSINAASTPDTWRIQLNIDDWNQIAVVF